MSGFWVFGYGSLMWNPGFPHDEMLLARLYGYHRSLCIYSYHHRGTQENPGLVLGLDRGGSCLGMAFHVKQENAEETLKYLIAREQISGVYIEKNPNIYLADGRKVSALAFVSNTTHEQYAGKIPPERMAAIIAKSAGPSGPNRDYVVNTVELLQKLSIYDHNLEYVVKILPPV